MFLDLDVQMPECDGFDVLELLGGTQAPAIVFVTAHDEYALRAFETGALDYLIKPFTNTRFQRALERAKERLMAKNTGQVLFVNVADIDWIEAASYYACLHVAPDTHVLRRSLAVLEQELEAGAFCRILCRIRRSTIVNVSRIDRLEITDNGEYAVVLKPGARLRLSRRFRKSLLACLNAAGAASHCVP